jgi:hypothetical protein
MYLPHQTFKEMSMPDTFWAKGTDSSAYELGYISLLVK